MSELPTAAEVAEYLAYDPLTGVFTWKKKTANGKAVVGAVAGSLSTTGYWQIGVLGRTHSAQRLAWLLSYGVWPDNEIDHADGIRLNNRLSNLRDCSHTDNMHNRAQWSEIAGARFEGDAWRAGIWANNRQYYLGRFKTAAEAHAAYVAAKRVLHPFAPELREPAARVNA